MTGGFLVELQRSALLTLTGNIRPAHMEGKKLIGKTKTKVDKWTHELLDNNAIIGNISVRLDPTKSDYDIWFDDEAGQTNLTINEGVLDCAVDSLSRIKAILSAADNPLGSFDLSTRFQVRIWLLDDAGAKKVATIYNTRGDKVNDSTAKFAYSETKEQELARRLVNGSEHLGQDNIEVLSNSVSASSHKMTAYNTISRAIETSWKGGPVTQADIEAQSSWLISAWDSLVKVRPEYGKLSTPARQDQRRDSIATSAVIIYGLVGAMSVMYADHVDPDVAFKALAAQEDGEDFFSWHNPRWSAAGIVTPSGSGKGTLGTRNSFPARRAAVRVLCEAMSLGTGDDAE
ncbi:DNA sulfur modification protein DndB [Micromonospora echinospora]|uniref:DNA sulfur modification protein DndB n=1 Tax=Micromonospora echinospora TaxID=1877 RepID=UPI00342B1F92